MGLGIYRNGSSFLHRCDPRAKVAAVGLFLVAAAVARGPVATALVVAAALTLWTASGQGVREAGHLFKPLVPLAVFIVLVNAASAFGVAAEEGEALGAVGAAMASGMVIAARLFAAFLGAATVMETTPPVFLTAAFRWFMRPLARLGVRVEEAAFSLTMVLRFVPLLGEEAVRIKAAQMSRGASFDTGGVVGQVRQWTSVITPLFVGALRRCDTVAGAVASRAFFAPTPHTSLVQLKGNSADIALVIGAFALVGAVMALACLS